MKSTDDIARELTRQWNNANIRETRLLMADSWPLKIRIGRPTSQVINQQPDKIRQHFQQWRQINIGEVVWTPVNYRGAAASIEVPAYWVLSKPSEWIEASGCKNSKHEYQQLLTIISQVDPIFHPYFVRQKRWLAKPADEVIKAARLAMILTPGFAQGVPLRSLGVANTDTKFFERNHLLIRQLLDIRFDGLASRLGLEEFLDAPDDSHHWLLIADLDGALLPFKQLRVRDQELVTTPLPADNILIVENEQCLHLLPALSNTIAILGAGLNLSWMQAAWLSSKALAYWGDMDTWGLTMLARARKYHPELSAILMNQALFNQYEENKAVAEPNPSVNEDSTALKDEEQKFLTALRLHEKGRLEQEFIPMEIVHRALCQWHLSSQEKFASSSSQ
ncbi:Wadjet anti-phage system protein JetD domain-containing protein [Endozoicomonas sp. ALB032]|uniref:Wadjet anti-phage system protein JetD domain-containing protein n=1 Tax=Endozoicomonas sp. ALB032 TaxID=3403082 RepID=UPI003BB59493